MFYDYPSQQMCRNVQVGDTLSLIHIHVDGLTPLVFFYPRHTSKRSRFYAPRIVRPRASSVCPLSVSLFILLSTPPKKKKKLIWP